MKKFGPAKIGNTLLHESVWVYSVALWKTIIAQWYEMPVNMGCIVKAIDINVQVHCY